jgi:uncharacterized surface protein with fasciclin (FAS1) repeats
MKTLLMAATAAALSLAATASRAADIVETAVAAGQFKTLAAALGAAGLVDTLKGPGPFTVFAPTDAAFAKLPAGTVENLLKPENKGQLTAILTYHVVPGKTMSSALAGKTLDVATVNGAKVRVDGTKGVRVNNATVTTADVAASNGVIHVIDTVLLPPAK